MPSLSSLQPTMRSLLLLVFVAIGIEAAAAEVQIGLSSSITYMEPVTLQVEITDAERRGVPTLGPIDGVTISGPRYGGNRTEFVNGRRSTSTIYQFALRPSRYGEFQVGPVSWTENGKVVAKSATLKLAAYKKPPIGIRFTATLSKTHAKIGEPVRLIYKLLYPHGSLDEDKSLFRSSAAAAFELPVFSLSGVRVKPIRLDTRLRAQQLNYQGERIFREEGFEVHGDGTASAAWIFAFEITPMSTGSVEIPSTGAQARLRTGGTQRGRNVWGDIVQVAETKIFSSKTQKLTLAVDELPSAGRPEGFSGAIGTSFQIQATTDDLEVKTYHPIKIQVIVKTDAELADLPAPDWTRVSSLTENFEVSPDVDTGEVRGDTKVFTQVIRAINPDVTEIPALPFPFYNPKSESYDVAYSEPIALQVTAGRVVGMEDTQVVRNTQAGSAEDEVISSRAFITRGVAANFDQIGTPSLLLTARNVIASLPFVMACGTPPLVFALVLLLVARSRRSSAEIASSKALATAKRALAASQSVDDTIAAYQQYFRERLSIAAGEVTAAQLQECLQAKKIESSLTEDAIKVLNSLNASRFGGGGSDLSEVNQQATQVVLSIEKAVGRS